MSVEYPHVEEFLAEVRRYVDPATIVLSSVRDDEFGVVDVVLFGPEASIGFVFGRQINRPLPYFLDAVYAVAALDVAHGVGDILYVAARNHGSLFQADTRLRLVPLCSSRILGQKPRRRSTYVGQGDDHEPFVIRLQTRRVAEPRRAATSKRGGRRVAPAGFAA